MLTRGLACCGSAALRQVMHVGGDSVRNPFIYRVLAFPPVRPPPASPFPPYGLTTRGARAYTLVVVYVYRVAFSDGKSCVRSAKGLARGDRKRSLNDGQIPNPSVVRVARGTGYLRVEANQRASRKGVASELPTDTIHFLRCTSQ
jgi:hypothetical protein